MYKKLTFLFLCIMFYAQAVFSQPIQRPVIWEVKEVHEDFVKIVRENNIEKKLWIDSETAIFRAEKKAFEDLKQGQFVSVSGIKMNGQGLRAFVINLVPEDINQGAVNIVGAGSQNTVYGNIINTAPLTIRSKNIEKIINIMPHTRIIKEVPVQFSEIMIGNKLRLMQKKIVILAFNTLHTTDRSSSFAKKRNRQTDNSNLNERNMPMPPLAETSKFNKTVINQRLNSIFGFKDPNILKPDIFSWYKNYAVIMNELGGYWMEPSAIWGFHWNLIQKRNKDGSYGKYNWERYDQMIRNAQAQNIQISAKIHASIPDAGKLATKRKRTPSLPKNIEAYCSFVKAVVERYDGDGIDDMPGLLYPVKKWKIEDEPVFPMFFNGTGSEYARLLRYAYGSIKSVDFDAKVICAMIYSIKGPLAGRNPNLFVSQFYKELKKSGNSPPYDIIDHHFISLDAAVPLKDRYLRLKKELTHIKESAKKAGFKTVPFESLEMAVPYSDEKTQAEDLVKHHVFALSLGIKKILWSGIKASPDSFRSPAGKGKNDPFMKNAIIHEDNTRKLAYYSYKKMVEILAGCDLSKVDTLMDKNNNYIYRFRKNNNYIWVIWNEGDGNPKMLINIPEGVFNVKITESVLKAANGKNVINDKYEFNQSRLNVTNSIITITADHTPVYIETY